MIDTSMQRPFLMVYSARPGRAGASDAIYRRAARPYYRVDVRDTRHLDFSDMAFWGGPLRERPVLGTIAPGARHRDHPRDRPGVLRPGAAGPALDAVVWGAAVSGSHGQDIRAGTVTFRFAALPLRRDRLAVPRIIALVSRRWSLAAPGQVGSAQSTELRGDIVAGALFRTKSIDRLLADVAGSGETTLKRTLGPGALVALGIGAIIGAGLFVRTAAAIAERSGPSVTLAFIVAGVGCAFAGLCYAEFASMIPIAGSAYTYSYATMGELVAWIIGWDLILEYAVGAATVAIAWSEYFNKVLEYVGLHIPYEWCHSPLEASPDGVHGIMNIPAIIILALLTALLIRGISGIGFVNSIIVVTKVTIVLMVIVHRLGIHQPGESHAVRSSADDLHDPAGHHPSLRRHHGHSGRRRRRVLRLHRIRRGVDRGAGGQEPEARHADRHPRARWSSARCSTCCSRTC